MKSAVGQTGGAFEMFRGILLAYKKPWNENNEWRYFFVLSKVGKKL